jgi:hypothetical protein
MVRGVPDLKVMINGSILILSAHRDSLLLTSTSSLATPCNAPVSVVFDGPPSSSSAALDWVVNTGILTRESLESGLLSLPCNNGVFSMSMDNMSVASSLALDLVLGTHWLLLIASKLGSE